MKGDPLNQTEPEPVTAGDSPTRGRRRTVWPSTGHLTRDAVTATRAAARTAFRLLPERQRSSIRRTLGRVAPWEPRARLRPPRCPPDMTVGPPDFVGVGAQKAGTTWWYELLAAHPEIYHHAGIHKERHFFMRFFESEFGAPEIEEYYQWFPRPAGHKTGEWTPDYMLHFWIPRLLKLAAPDAKLLVLVRDPVERIVSGLTHVMVNQAVPDARAATEAYVRGRYFDQLAALKLHFDPSQLHVLQFEKCRRDPLQELQRTFAFLGLPPFEIELPPRRPINKTTVAKVTLPTGARQELVALYWPDVEKLAAAWPEIDLELWPNFAFLTR